MRTTTTTTAQTASGDTVAVDWLKWEMPELMGGRRRYAWTGNPATPGWEAAATTFEVWPHVPAGYFVRVYAGSGRQVASKDGFPTAEGACEWATGVAAHYHETGRWPGAEMFRPDPTLPLP